MVASFIELKASHHSQAINIVLKLNGITIICAIYLHVFYCTFSKCHTSTITPNWSFFISKERLWGMVVSKAPTFQHLRLLQVRVPYLTLQVYFQLFPSHNSIMKHSPYSLLYKNQSEAALSEHWDADSMQHDRTFTTFGWCSFSIYTDDKLIGKVLSAFKQHWPRALSS